MCMCMSAITTTVILILFLLIPLLSHYHYYSLFEIRDLSSMHHTSPIVSADTLQHSALPHPISSTSTATTTSSDPTSLTALQSLAVTGANFGLRDVLSITTAKQTALHTTMLNTLHHNNNSTTNNTGSNNSDVSNKLSPSIDQWAALATISHVEVSSSACIVIPYCWVYSEIFY